MPRRSNRRTRSQQEGEDETNEQQRSVPSHVRERQRAVAEREAARLARPESRPIHSLAHADRKKSAVSTTPSGILPPKTTEVHSANAGWCGPFSVARQMIAQREEEARKKEEEEREATPGENHPLDEAMLELEQERKRKHHPSISWKSSVDTYSHLNGQHQDDDDDNGSPAKKKKNKALSLYETRKRRATMVHLGTTIPSLYDLCINYLVDQFEHVESVGFVDASIHTRLVRELVSRNALNDVSLAALTVPGMEALEVVDASGISSSVMATCLESILPAGLRHLVLDQAGRCFGPKAAQLLHSNGNSSQTTKLEALAIGGAYLLKDDDAANIIAGIQGTLQSVGFKACPLVGENLCKSLLNSKELRLRELSLEDLKFSDQAWSTLVEAATTTQFWSSHLESLRLRRLDGLTDEKLESLLAKPSALAALDLGLNYHLSDASLAAIRASHSCGSLSELRLPGLKLLTATGLEALFTHIPNMGPPPRLKLLDLGQCDHEAVTDPVIELVAQASAPAPSVAPTRSSYTSGLAHLNIQGSSLVTDNSLEVLVATCGQTMAELSVSFCTQLTDQGLGYFVDKCGMQLKTLEVWGLAQLSEVFFDGHKRVKDPSLRIVGAWMKANSVFAIR